MTKADIVATIQTKAGLSSKAAADRAVDAVLDVVKEALANGETVTFTGFGAFKTSKRAARSGRNPQTGKTIEIPASTVVKFTPGKTLKDAVQ